MDGESNPGTSGQNNTTIPANTTSTTTPNPDRASNPNNNNPPKTGVVQPKPQSLPKRTAPSSIIVSPRQKGNPVLAAIKSLPWEWGDIPADYVLGLTTCALFLSLKYHRLHPEYIYTRIKNLQGKFLLRLVLCVVDIDNHEESLRELSKTSLINNVTLILCWSSAEGARYLELFKQYENAQPTAIKQHQSTSYSDRMIDFITTPRSVNKTDAVSLVSQFGSLRTAVNARHEDVAGIAGWGEKKVQRWCASVTEPFRIQRAARRGVGREVSGFVGEGASPAPAVSGDVELRPNAGEQDAASDGLGTADADLRPSSRLAEQVSVQNGAPFEEDEEALAEAMTSAPVVPPKHVEPEVPRKRKADEEPVNDGVMAALSKLRREGG